MVITVYKMHTLHRYRIYTEHTQRQTYTTYKYTTCNSDARYIKNYTDKMHMHVRYTKATLPLFLHMKYT